MMSGIKERIARIEPATADRLLAAAMILGLAAETAAFADSDPGRVAASAGLAVALATLVVRRSRPLIPLVSILVADFAMAALEPGLFGTIALPFLGLMVAIYSTARHTPGSEGVWYCVVAVLIAAAPTSLLHDDIPGPAQFLWLLVLGGAPAVVGRTLLSRRNIQDELRARTQELERESEIRASHAIENERVRIAGELQAVVANGVSAMVVQAEAVPRVIAAGQIERAAESLGLIEETGRDALAEMRRLLGVLRRDDEAGDLAPQPTLDQAGHLVKRAHELGLNVALELEGERVSLPIGIDLAAYRVIEETLGSAAAAGARTASVVIAYGGEELRLEVRDDRVGGEGEAEQRRRRDGSERIGLYGGRLRVEPLADGRGQRLLARMPLGGAPA